MRPSLALLAILLAPLPASAEAPVPPAFALAGPYGSPFTLAARPPVALPMGPKRDVGGAAADGRGGPPLASARVASPAATGAPGRRKEDDEEDDDDDDDPIPAKPGSFPTTFMKVPDPVPNQKKRSLGPHLRPDAEFALDDRTTFGIIGQLDRLHTGLALPVLGRTSPPTNATGRPSAGTTPHGRDVGFGATLEFKLGQ